MLVIEQRTIQIRDNDFVHGKTSLQQRRERKRERSQYS